MNLSKHDFPPQSAGASAGMVSAGAAEFVDRAKRVVEDPILTLADRGWETALLTPQAISAVEIGKVLFLPKLSFALSEAEHAFLTPEVRDPKYRNISLDGSGRLKGANGDAATQAELAAMLGRFRLQAQGLITSMLPHYAEALRLAPTSYRPAKVESRAQSWRADDRRLHVDAFPSRPNRGERILRVFTNINPHDVPRVWRVGESFEAVARHFLPRAKAYSRWQSTCLHALRVTKSRRSEYDHLMLQLHDGMKGDLDYQQDARQTTIDFPPGSTWICFSDQTSHAVMSGQYLLEQTFHLSPSSQYDPGSSPLAILSRLTNRSLI